MSGRWYLYCQTCGKPMELGTTGIVPYDGRVCSQTCWKEFELRKVRHIINKGVEKPPGFGKHLLQTWPYTEESIPRKYCHHPRHGTPCPLPCSGCVEECGIKEDR